MIELNNFYVGESVTFMRNNIPDNSVDLTVTSPPYDDLRNYNGFVFDYKSMLLELYRVTKQGGVVVWIVGDKTHKGSETLTSFQHALYAKEIGFNVHDTMIYAKNNVYAYDPRNKRYKQSFEYMFIFSKGKPNTYNEIKDRSNKHAGKILTGTKGRTKDGVKRDLKPTVMSDFQARFNIWEYTTGGSVSKDKIAFDHPAIFPEQLALDHIITWSNEGDVILDPMCGSGTVCKQAWLNKRNFIGIDMSEEYINDICIPRLHLYEWEQNENIFIRNVK